MAWFIDAWSAADGLAFASQREQGAPRADLTVYLAAPEFHPLPVASLSTAWWATRTNFQEGFLDEDGVEVAFATLDDVIEAVRRAFLAGGHGLPPPSGVPVPRGTPPPGGEPRTGPGPGEPQGPGPTPEPLARRHMEWNWRTVHQGMSELDAPEGRDRLASELNLLLLGAEELLADFSRRTLRALLSRLKQATRPVASEVDTLRRWLALLSGAWLDRRLSSPYEWMEHLFADEFQELGSDLTGPQEPPLWYWPHTVWRAEAGSSILRGTLFEVPFPPEWPAPKGAQVELGSLGDVLCLAMADHLLLRELSSVEEFVPLLLIARVVVGEAYSWSRYSSPLYGRLAEQAGHEVIARAARWLADFLPGERIHEHFAEQAIRDFPTKRGRPRGGPTAPPHGHGPMTPRGGPSPSTPSTPSPHRRRRSLVPA